MNKSNLMSKAHKIAKTLIGDYAARLSMALKMVWSEIKKGVKKMVELIGTEKQIAWAKDIKEELIKNVEGYKESFNAATYNKRNYLIKFKEEILKDEIEKMTNAKAAEKLNKILDNVILNIKNETSAKKLIDIKTSFKMADATIENYLIREFI